jgi:hypothetical protein
MLCYDFLNIFAEKFSKKLVFLTQNKAKLFKIVIITLVFEKNANFFAENCRKSQKIVIITSTPDEFMKKSPQCSPSQFSSKLIYNLYLGESGTKMCATFLFFKITAQSKQSLTGRKFAQSGHPAATIFHLYTYVHFSA